MKKMFGMMTLHIFSHNFSKDTIHRGNMQYLIYFSLG